MSVVSISYSSIRNASNNANRVAIKIDRYADSLHRNVFNKLNKYDGNWNANVSNAYSRINAKITNLRNEQSRYEKYSINLNELKEHCREVDKAVKSKVSTLTASFKKRNHIRNNMVENFISYHFTMLGNKTNVGRWLGNRKDEFDSVVDYFKSSIKQWYNYDGGKQYLKGIVESLVKLSIAVCTAIGAVAAFLSSGTLLAAIVCAAVLIKSGLEAYDAGVNLGNEYIGFLARENDPATAERRSDINSLTSFLRSSYMFGNNGEIYHYDETYNNMANNLDVTCRICSVISIGSDCSNLLKNGFKWATGNSNATLKELFTKNGMKDMFNGAHTKISELSSEIHYAIKVKDVKYFKTSLREVKKDSLNNFKNTFLNFNTIEKGVSSLKNGLGVIKEMLDESNRFKIAAGVILPAIGLFDIPGENEMIAMGDFFSIYFDIEDLFKNDEKDNYCIHKNVINYLSTHQTKETSILDRLSINFSMSYNMI